MIRKRINWKFYRPYLGLYCDLGFLFFCTQIMHEAQEMDIFTYIRFEWRFFKWRGHFKLYRPGYDIKRNSHAK